MTVKVELVRIAVTSVSPDEDSVPVPDTFVILAPTQMPFVLDTVKVVLAEDAVPTLVMFGLGLAPQPKAMYDAYAGEVPIKYFAIISLPVLVIIIYLPHILYH